MENTGIYQIKSIKTGRIYIGSAINIKTRWNRHKNDLFKNVHHSSFLQRHYNKYGIDDLVFSVIEFCKKEELLLKEQVYLDSLNCEFNTCKIAGSCYGIKKSEEFKRKISVLTSGENNPTYGLERTKEWRDNISKANQGQKAWNKGKTEIYSESTLLKMKESALNKEKVLCEHCNNEVTPHNFKRWHGENCDYKNVPEKFKKCSNCKSVLNKENFNKNKRQLDGFDRQCKKCKSERNKNNYKSRISFR